MRVDARPHLRPRPSIFRFRPATIELLYMVHDSSHKVAQMSQQPTQKSSQLHHESLVSVPDFTRLSTGGDKPRSTSLHYN